LTTLTLTVAAVIAAAALGLPRAKRWGEDRLRRGIEARAAAVLGGSVRIARLRIDLVPPAVRLESIETARRGNRGSEAVGAADEVSVRASVLTLLRATRGPVIVKVKRPRLRIRLAAGRPLDLAAALGGGGGPGEPSGPGGAPDAATALAAVPAGSSLEMKDGVMEIELGDGPGVRLEGLQLDASPQPGGGLRGRAAFSAGEYRGPGGKWKGLSGDASFVAAGAELRFEPLSIRADGLSLSGRATLREAGAPLLEGALDAAIEMDRMARFFPEGAAPAGQLRASLTGSVRGGGPQARGDLELANLRLWGLSVGTLRSDVVIDDAVHLRGIRAHLLGGEATGSADVSFSAGRFRAETDLRVDGVDAAQVLEHAAWTGPPLTGTIHYSGRHRVGSGGLDSLGGSGVLDAVGHYRSPRGEDLPLEITADLATEGGTVRLSNGSLRAGSTRASFSGTVARGEGIRLKLSGGTGNLSEILPLFAPPVKPPRPQERPPGPGAGATRPASRDAPHAFPAVLPASWPPRGITSLRAGRRLEPRAAVGAARTDRGAAAASPPADAAGPLERIVRLLGGRWEWDGDLGYGREGLEFTGTLRGFDLTYRGAPIGSLRARVVYRDDVLAVEEGALRLDEESFVDLSGRIDFRGEGSLAIDATATRFPLEPVLAAVGIPAPVRGRLSGHIVLGGRPDAPAGRAHVEAAPIVVAGMEFDGLQGDLTFTPDLLELRSVTLSQGQGRLAVEGRIPYRDAEWLPEEGGALPGLSLSGSGLDLSLGLKAARALRLRGTALLEGWIGGALAAPRGSITARAAGVEVGGVSVGDVRARVDLSGDAARIDVQAPARGLSIAGRIGLGEGEPSDLRAVLSGMEIAGHEIVHGVPEEARLVLAGEVQARGPLASPEMIEARAALDRVEASMAGVRLAAQGPVEVTLSGGRMTLAPVTFGGEGTSIELRAGLGPGAAGTIDLAASGVVDLKLLRLFVKGLQATGAAQIAMKVGGSLAAPVFEGRLQAEAEAMRHPDLPFPINRLYGSAAFEGNRLRIESLDFLAGGGLVQGAGEFLLGDLERSESPFTIRRATIRFQGANVKAEFPEGFRSVADLDVTLRRERGETSLAGAIDLVRSVYGKDFELGAALGRPRASEVFRARAGGPFAGIGLDVVIRAPRDVWLRNDFGTIEGQGELRVRGPADRPSLAGRITAVEGGTIRFRKVAYRVLAGTMDFSDPEVIDPVFDVQAETRLSEYQVTLHVEGTLNDFRYELSSNPPLPEQDIVALLLTGRTLGSFGQEGGGLAEETISSYLTGRLTGELEEKVSGKAGIDVFSIDPLQVNAQGDPTTRITVGKQVTPDLFVAYSSDLGSTQGSVYQLDYALRRDFHFSSLRDRDGSIGGELKYILRGKPPAAPGVVEPAAAAPILGEIRLEGDLRFKESRVRRVLRVRKGKPRDRSAVNLGVDRLVQFYRNRGFLMADVDYHESLSAGGRADLTFHVQTGPRVEVAIEGARGRAALKQDVAPFWQKGLFMEDIVEQARAHLEKVLRDRGYLKAAVDSEVLRHDAETVRVSFTMRRGPRTRADEVRIAGARQLSEKEIRKIIRTAPDGPLTRGLVKDALLEQDAAAVRALYLSRGFPLAAVPAPEVILDDTGRRAVVTFRVEEGPEVMLGRPRFEGNVFFAPRALEKAAGLQDGMPYTGETMDAATVRLRRLYDESGYPDARITRRPLETARTEAAPVETARVENPVFEIEEGRHQKIGEVRISGNVLTHDSAIRKALSIEPGTSLSRGELQASQTRLYGRGIFRSVSVEPGPFPATGAGDAAGGPAGEAAPPAAPPDGAVQPEGIVERDVNVSVREMAPLTQVFGLGYDSEEKLRGQYEISNRNIFGSGRYVGLQTRASDVQQRGALSYREKGLFGGRYDLLASAFAENERRPSFDVKTLGSSIQMSRRFTSATRTLYRYSLKDVDLSDTSVTFEGTTLRLSSVATSAIHDTRDAPFDPLRGHYLSGEVQFFGRGLGSEAEFVKMYAQIYRFRQVFPRTVWAQALRAGAAVPFGRSKDDPASTGDTLSGVPPSERFFAGGDTTVRGFERDRLGPLDINGDPIGGEGLFVLNEELRFPIYSMLGGVIFYDAGNVYRTLADYDVGDLRHVAGFGLRLATPIGPFRVEYGALLDRGPGEPRGELFFSIGQAF
jgi:outer membrane protein assembly factor BamA